MNIRYRLELSRTERDELTALLSGDAPPARTPTSRPSLPRLRVVPLLRRQRAPTTIATVTIRLAEREDAEPKSGIRAPFASVRAAIRLTDHGGREVWAWSRPSFG